jgi:hypothetical protein
MRSLSLGDYDRWKLATPPEWEWLDGEEQRYIDQREAEETQHRVAALCECGPGCRPAPMFDPAEINDEVPF